MLIGAEASSWWKLCVSETIVVFCWATPGAACWLNLLLTMPCVYLCVLVHLQVLEDSKITISMILSSRYVSGIK